MKTRTFKVTIDGKSVEFLVKSPSLHDQREGQKIYNQAFTDAIRSKSVVRAKLEDLLSDQGLWSNDKEAKFSELQKELLEGEKRLAKGGFSLNEAKDLAIKMKSTRDEMRALISIKTSLDNHSAEGQADNARFNYLVSVCVVYNNSNKDLFYKNMEDYLDRSNEEVGSQGAQTLANMLYGLDNDYESNLAENKFLKKYKFIDEKLRLVDKRGRLIDSENRLLDENNRFINEEGAFVDKFGNIVDAAGDYVTDSQPFLDESGNPIILDEVTNEKKTETIVEPVATPAQEVVASTPEVVEPNNTVVQSV